MIELTGKYNKAKVFTNNIEETAISQIIELCNQEFVKDSRIRIMPDVHAGAGCTIGTTMTINDKVVPNLVGVDIGCGMKVVELGEVDIDFNKLDDVIRKYIPSGQLVNEIEYNGNFKNELNNLKCKNNINMNRALCSIGTLGGGNHFIEIDKDRDNNKYLVIHSGSRYLGKQVAEYYQNKGYEVLKDQSNVKKTLIEKLKLEGRKKDIQKELKLIPSYKGNKSFAYVENKLFDDYIYDMNIVQKYAILNRNIMANIILDKMGANINELSSFTTVHNYIDFRYKNNKDIGIILRKGSISAYLGEKVIIPMNMKDGSIIALGKGSADWNYSAPHGAGRVMSRSKAKENVTIDEFKKSMNGIWSTSICESTIDESPMVYKPMQEIIDNIGDTVEIINIIKPIYNFKAN